MAGRPDFSNPGTDGGGQVVATTSRPEVKHIDVGESSAVASGTTIKKEVYAPSGSIYQILGIVVKARTDGNETSGTHRWRVQDVTNWAQIDFRSDYTANVAYDRAHVFSANDFQRPSTEIAQQNVVQNLHATENSPIRFRYDNNTDTATSSVGPTIELSVKESSY